jgi:hypothetical protein
MLEASQHDYGFPSDSLLGDCSVVGDASEKHLLVADSLWFRETGFRHVTACFDRNQTWWQAFKLMTESRNSRRQKPAGDDLRLFIQDTEVALAVAKIDPNHHSSNGFSFSKTNQRSNVSILWHSPLSCSCTYFVHVRQLTATKLTALSHPILTEEAGG